MPRKIFPPRDFICIACGAAATGKYVSKKYCPECEQRRERDAQRARYARNKKPRVVPTKECVTCGKPFYCQPHNQGRLKTCSPECEAKNRSQPREGEVWAYVEQKRLEGLLRSPKTGRFDTHVNAHWWKIQSPSGEIYEFRNLRLWVDQNSHLFDGTTSQAYNGILNTKAAITGKNKRGARQWKGWRLLEWGE